MCTHLIHVSLGPPDSTSQTASRSVQPFLQGSRLWQTDWQTDHANPSVTIGRIYVVLRCGLIITGTFLVTRLGGLRAESSRQLHWIVQSLWHWVHIGSRKPAWYSMIFIRTAEFLQKFIASENSLYTLFVSDARQQLHGIFMQFGKIFKLHVSCTMRFIAIFW